MADLILHGGVLLQPGSERPAPQALAVRDGRIVAIGSDDDVRNLGHAGTRNVDLGGRTLVPGFIDAHAHVWKMGHLLTSMLDLRGVRSLQALSDVLRTTASTRAAGTWLLGRGFNESAWPESRRPTRADLDRAAPGHPVALTRVCGHIAVLSSAALLASGIRRDTPDPPGGVIGRGADGEPDGLLYETALGLFEGAKPAPETRDLEDMIEAALRHQLSVGITSTTDAGVTRACADAYLDLAAEGRLPARVNVMPLGKPDASASAPLFSKHLSDFLRIDTVKFLADGGLSGATAALSIPYRHDGSRGVLRLSREELTQRALDATRAGWRLAVHAIGDAAIALVLDVFEEVERQVEARVVTVNALRRPRIEHLALPTDAHLRRAARLGVIAVPQTVFLHELGRNFRETLPESFLARVYPVRSMRDARLTVALSSDAPVVLDDAPLRGIRAAVERRDLDGHEIAPDQSIGVAEALMAYTRGGAIASGDEENRGSLTAGKWADFAILSGNPLETPVERLTELEVEETYVAGRLAWEA